MAKQAGKKRVKRQYSDEQKASVLANLDANGGNVAKTAREAEVPRDTLNSWKNGIGINDDVLNIQHVKKEDLRDLHKLIAVKALGLMQTKLENCSAAQLSTIAAISTDKMLVLGGEPNSITRTEALPEDERERIKRELREKAASPLISEAHIWPDRPAPVPELLLIFGKGACEALREVMTRPYLPIQLKKGNVA